MVRTKLHFVLRGQLDLARMRIKFTAPLMKYRNVCTKLFASLLVHLLSTWLMVRDLRLFSLCVTLRTARNPRTVLRVLPALASKLPLALKKLTLVLRALSLQLIETTRWYFTRRPTREVVLSNRRLVATVRMFLLYRRRAYPLRTLDLRVRLNVTLLLTSLYKWRPTR